MKRVDSVGRIVIPKEIRKELNLQSGAGYELVKEENGIKIIPLTTNFTICNEDMKVLRKLYVMLADSGMLDTYYDEILSRITKRAVIKCENCGSYLFLDNNENTYKCFKCE